MEQGGVYRVTLYENKDLSLSYFDGNISSITNSGNVLEIENSDCDTSFISFIIKPQINANNRMSYKYELSYTIFDYSIENLELIKKLKQSIYGWIAKVEFYNLDQYVIPAPLKFINSRIDNNVSNSFAVTLENVVFAGKMITFVDVSGNWILATGIWNDSGIWIDTELWKDN